MDIDDIEDLLEAPYKDVKKSIPDLNSKQDQTSNGIHEINFTTNGVENQANGDVKMKENGNDSVHSQDDLKSKSDEFDKEKNKKSRKNRSRSRSREHRYKKRSRSRSKSRSKRSKRDRTKSKERKDRRRTRSRSRDRRRGSRSKSHERRRGSRSRSRDRRRRSRSRSYDRRRSRDRRRHSRSPKRARSPELTPEERDIRTVFCMQLSNRIRPRDLEDFFKPCGAVRDVRLITDPRTKRSKGIAYIEFKEVDSVDKAIGLTGQRLLGVPIICKLTQAEKNRMPLVIPSQGTAVIPVTGSMKLYIGSLHVNINEDMLKGIFEPFGNIDTICLSKDDFGRSKGYGYIQFTNADDAKKAMEQLNNFELANRPIKVAPFIEKPTDIGQITNLDNEDLDKTGVNLGPSGKLALMAKLAEGTGIKIPESTVNAISASKQDNEDSNTFKMGSTSLCFILSNMFDLEEEKNRTPNWVQEIKEDVIEECTKYGGIVHISIDEQAPNGCIYIKCASISVALAAVNGLNGRYFAGKMIQASFIPIETYNQLFPNSINAQKILQSSS